MLTINEILTLKVEMEEEGFITCSDLFIERLRALEDEKNDAIATALQAKDVVGDWFKGSSASSGNTPINTDGEGGYINPNA